MSINTQQQNTLLARARRSIAAGLSSPVGGRGVPCDEDMPADPLYAEIRAVFVTLHLCGRLRGCIGSLEARESLWQNVWHMAQAAAFGDPRFPPVSASEFEALDIEISILSPFREAKLDEIVAGKHGVLLEEAGRSAVFLPQVATEQGWSKETMLSELCRKAGLPAASWKNTSARFSVFTAEKFGEAKK